MLHSGVVQPLLVVREGDGFRLVAGERRLRAARLVGIRLLPVLVLASADAVRAQLVENAVRLDLHWLELAAGYGRLIAEGYTQSELARLTGTTPSWVSRLTKARAGLSPEALGLLEKTRADPSVDQALRWGEMCPEKQLEAIQEWQNPRRRSKGPPRPEGMNRATIRADRLVALYQQAKEHRAHPQALLLLRHLMGKARNPWGTRRPGPRRPKS